MQIPKKILVIQGNPDSNSFSQALADSYLQGAQAVGHEADMLMLARLQFNPVLQHGYKERTPWEPDLEMAWEKIRQADHLVWVYPTWWGTMPALMKGFIDRVFLPGKTFKYRSNSILWDKLLTGKTARIITSMDSPVWYNTLVYRSAGHRVLKNAVLVFCGVSPVRITTIGSQRQLSAARRAGWLQQITALGTSGR